ncbi:hypothetical protein OG592_42465 (plasmid) [Streptomyces avidinii]|uniref:hypothetical protein n=1 Tax=Streptomyces avidinii TaxID=1895 RepID=UPI002F911F0D|nr:hypothetical protein OG592_42465 [Streptomyces avidinii]
MERGQSGGGAAANRNAVRGDPYGGSAELDHNLIWRPGWVPDTWSPGSCSP